MTGTEGTGFFFDEPEASSSETSEHIAHGD